MVLPALASHLPRILAYAPYALAGYAIFTVIRILAEGRKTGRDRDLHGRTIIITAGGQDGGMYVRLIEELAKRGARIILLMQELEEIMIDILRASTENEEIYGEQVDFTSSEAITEVCKKFLTIQQNAPKEKAAVGGPPMPNSELDRIDALIFLHEYAFAGSQRLRDTNSLATFAITTALLPVLLRAPVERDIRIVNVVNRFYAASAPLIHEPGTLVFPSFDSKDISKPRSALVNESIRSQRTILFTRHLQRVLDALPSASASSQTRVPLPQTSTQSGKTSVADTKTQLSNIVASVVSPGMSRPSVRIHPILRIIGWPLIWLFTKSPTGLIQSILHVLFLPTPFKMVGADVDDILIPGRLYAECSVMAEVAPGIETGQMVWECYESALKEWVQQAKESATGKGKEKAS